MDVGVGVGMVLGAGVEFSGRCIAPTDIHLSWGPCHLVTMSVGYYVTW
jgi:hypothetical protein